MNQNPDPERWDRAPHPCPLASILAARLRNARDEVTLRWLERISARVSVDPNTIFPSESLLDHVPILIDGIADQIEHPAQTVSAETPVIAKAMELGALRHAQGFGEHELLKEYEILGGVIFAFLGREVRSIEEPCEKDEIFACAHRLFQAIALIEQATLLQFLQLVRETLSEREDRLRAFNRSLTHEFRNRVNAVLGAGLVLRVPTLSQVERERLGDVVARNGEGMQVLLDNLLELSQLEVDTRRHRHVKLRQAVSEATRQLRDAAELAGVTIFISPELPELEVHAAAIELCVTNLISNAIKYANPAKAKKWVEVRGHVNRTLTEPQRELVIEVRDNGLGVPQTQRERLFEQFFRAGRDENSTIPGTGLGLSIVRETIESIGGRVRADFPPEGSLFTLILPLRRSKEQEDAPR